MASLTGISTRERYAGTLYFVALLRKELGRRIKTARTAAGMTQRELADAIHLKNATDVSRYERGATEVPSHRIDLIAEATGRPRSYFTRDPDEPETASAADLQAVQQGLADLRRFGAQLDRIEALLRGPQDDAREPPAEGASR